MVWPAAMVLDANTGHRQKLPVANRPTNGSNRVGIRRSLPAPNNSRYPILRPAAAIPLPAQGEALEAVRETIRADLAGLERK
jgi:hypothetical protein